MFEWKNRKGAVILAANLHSVKGWDFEAAIEHALGIDEGFFYGAFCRNVEHIPTDKLECFISDVVAELSRRRKIA